MSVIDFLTCLVPWSKLRTLEEDLTSTAIAWASPLASWIFAFEGGDTSSRLLRVRVWWERGTGRRE